MRRVSALAPIVFCITAAALADESAERLQQHLDSVSAAGSDAAYRLLDPIAVRHFYERRDFRPAWMGADCASAVRALAAAIHASEEHGLNSADYHRDALSRPEACGPNTELRATDAWLSLAAHLHAGRVDPVTVESDWTAIRPDIDLAARLEEALAARDIGDALLALAPRDDFYRALRDALKRFREYAARGGWAGVDAGPTLRVGDTGPRVRQLRARLALSGLFDTGLADSQELFDETLEVAVKAFQRRANLEPDGIVGVMTLHQLNQRAVDRIAQLRVNLERWRWLPEDLGERHVRVNIANFQLEARAHGRIERAHRVIVGRLYRRTPSFSGRISYIVLNPWWETPHKLAVQDKLPLFGGDPHAVEQLGFEILDAGGQRVDPSTIDWDTVSADRFPYRLRQRPGPMNALGQVKLMFPNPHNVYLHDTPTRGLFAKVRRDFSSGCIRVEEALDLTEWLLAGTPAWDRARIDAAVASGAATTVPLAEAVPVHIVYLTAVADETGGVRFVDDLYGRDPAVLGALDAPPSAARLRR
jgi:murein L,D-transpeptidase YcbB/YkuD